MMVIRAVLLLSIIAPVTQARKNKMVSVGFSPDLSFPQINGELSRALANTSLTPWTYRSSFVASRIPARISQAECLTSGCIGLQGGGENAALKTLPIKYQILVLHRVPKKNNKQGKKKRPKYDLKLGRKVITVGCTCVRPLKVPQN